jgi:hypothetical protein
MLDAAKERMMKLITNPLLKSLVATAVLAGACAAVGAEDKSVRAPVPTENYSGVSGIGEYVAEHASDEQYALFQRNNGLTTLVVSYDFGEEGSRSCVAQVGLTHAPLGDKAMPRMPANRFYGGASDPSFSKEKCTSTAVWRALDALLSNEASWLQARVNQTLLAGGKRPVEKASNTMTQSSYWGMNDAGNLYIHDATPDWFKRAFDYRAVVTVKRFKVVEGDNGQVICIASIGLTARAPTGRQDKEPLAEHARALTLNKSERAKADQDATCFDPLFDRLVKNNFQPDADLIKTFIDTWARVAEPGLKAPTLKDVDSAVAWQAERDRKAVLAREREEARSVRVAQANSCTVNCVNGACVRHWPNGRSERFQAPRKFNPFNSQWEWDTSGC